MKVGDLVHCVWQPGGKSNRKTICVDPMEHTIKGEVGIIESVGPEESPRYLIVFPQLGGYTHHLSHSAFEVISEDR